VDWIYLAQDRDEWQAVVNTVMKLPLNVGIYQLADKSVFSRRTVLHGVGWMFGWLVGWLVGRSVGQSVSRLVGLLVGWLFGWLVGWLVGLGPTFLLDRFLVL
jgi:hypothetical protein